MPIGNLALKNNLESGTPVRLLRYVGEVRCHQPTHTHRSPTRTGPCTFNAVPAPVLPSDVDGRVAWPSPQPCVRGEVPLTPPHEVPPERSYSQRLFIYDGLYAVTECKHRPALWTASLHT